MSRLTPEDLKARLASLGYEAQGGDEASLGFCLEKVRNTIQNETNQPSVPEELERVAVDMAAGEFLLAKKTFAPGDIAGLDLDYAVKQIQAGDTNTVFATGDASQTPEQRLTALIQHLLTRGREELLCFRKLKW